MISLDLVIQETLSQRPGHIIITRSPSGELSIDFSLFAPKKGASMSIDKYARQSELISFLESKKAEGASSKKDQLREDAVAYLQREVKVRDFDSAYKVVFQRSRGRPPLNSK